MAVTLAAMDYQMGFVPRVCPVTGRPAQTFVPKRFTTVPPWTIPLIFFGLVGLLAMLVLQKSAPGGLFVSDDAIAARRRRRRFFGLVFAFWPALWIGAIVAAIGTKPGDTLNAFAAAAFAVALIPCVVGAFGMLRASGFGRIRGNVFDGDDGNRWLELRNVHPVFAATMHSMQQQRWNAMTGAPPVAYYPAPPPQFG